MFKQSICLVEFGKLYNILDEIKHLFTFKIYNYDNCKKLIQELEENNSEYKNSIIILNKENNLLLNSQVNKNNILIINPLPLTIQKFLDDVNSHLIKQKYNFQSKLIIKDYTLNLNSRIISNLKNELKLTEREIDIITFLNDNNLPQSIKQLQNQVWGYSSGLETHTVETHIYRLRKKIKDKFNDEKFIKSVDTGYQI